MARPDSANNFDSDMTPQPGPDLYEGRGESSNLGPTVEIDQVENTLRELVRDAVDFMESEIIPGWEDRQNFYDGETDLKRVKGRSGITDTVLRDAIVKVKPNILRVFTQAQQIVKFKPSIPVPADGEKPDLSASIMHLMGARADLQTRYVNQLFWKYDGYQILADATQEVLAKRVSITKVWTYDRWDYEYLDVVGVTGASLDALEEEDNTFVYNVTESEETADVLDMMGKAIQLYDATVAVGSVKTVTEHKHVKLLEFFVDEDATCVEDSRVIGQRRSITIAEAMQLGLEYEKLDGLDDLDISAQSGAEEEAGRRGYFTKYSTDAKENDPMQSKVLITEAYAHFDLLGIGVPQLYRFWLGGTQYRLLAYEQVDEHVYNRIVADPEPGAFFGKDFYDRLAENQNTNTSILRATADNFHLSNNRRLAVHEKMVNLNDVLDSRIGAPIRFKAPGMIQEIGVQSSIGAALPLLEYLKRQAEEKVGVTAAAAGLDPNALQSTDKDAVRNTIALAQGQVELIARNMAWYGIRSICLKLLKHTQKYNTAGLDVVDVDGQPVPVNLSVLDPELFLETEVGLGSASFEMHLAGLNNVQMQQEKIISAYGVDNPIVTPAHYYNTMSDIARAYGLTPSRYFQFIDVGVSSQIQQGAAEARKNAGPDPATALLQAEQVKAQAVIEKARIDAAVAAEKTKADTRNKMIEISTEDDYRRDKMAGDFELERAKLEEKSTIDLGKLRAEQAKVRQSAAKLAMERARGADQAPNRGNPTPNTNSGRGEV